MKYKSAVFCFFTLASLVCKAQQYKFIYYLDADLRLGSWLTNQYNFDKFPNCRRYATCKPAPSANN